MKRLAIIESPPPRRRLRGLGLVTSIPNLDPPPHCPREDCSPNDGPCIARNLAVAAQENANWDIYHAATLAQSFLGAQSQGRNPNINDEPDLVKALLTGAQSPTYYACNPSQTNFQPTYEYVSPLSPFFESSKYTPPPQQVQAPAPAAAPQPQPAAQPAPAPAPHYSPALQFVNLNGDAAKFAVGDTWRITITGAPPNSPVTYHGGKNGADDAATMGSTDANGTFMRTGTVSTTDIGAWNETWSAGGLVAGAFAFQVVAPTAPAAAPPSSAGTQTVTTGGGSPPASAPAPATSAVGGSMLDSILSALPAGMADGLRAIPSWLWTAGGTALLLWIWATMENRK